MASRDSYAPRARRAANALFFFLGASALGAYAGCSSSPSPSTDVDAGADASTIDTGSPDTAADDATAPSDADPVDAEDASFDCGDAGNDLPNDLRCTGLYSDWATKTVASTARAYAPGYLLWSDGATKSRWISLPGNTPAAQIDSSNMDEWTFPVGTKVWKEFKLGEVRIETRIFWKRGPSDWLWTTYRWSADEKQATRLDSGETNVNATTYEIPSHSQCAQCHGGRLDRVLGFDAVSLGGSKATGFKLDTLVGQGWLSVNPPVTPTIPEDGSGNARTAVGWLHANCGTSCHNANQAALAHGTGLYMRVNTAQLTGEAGVKSVKDLDTYITAVNVVPNMSQFAAQGFLRIKPGDVSKSLIPTLDGARNDPGGIPQMPPIISHQVDMQGLTAVKNWIATMSPDGG